MIADQREAFGTARQIVAVVAGDAADRHVDGLADQELRTGRLAVDIAGIARIELPAAVRTEAVDAVEIERRRAEILDRGRVGFLLADRGEIERDVVIDELPEIGEAGGDLGVVAGGDRPGWRPSSRRRAPAAARRRRRAVRGSETSARTCRDRHARKANREIAGSDGGQPCHGQAGHSLVLPSLPPIGCWEKRGTGVSRCQVIKGSGKFASIPLQRVQSAKPISRLWPIGARCQRFIFRFV